ncbi:MAG: hypothetical protein HYY14_04660 [Candidatus Omnitrophica bacterium]|nr:hypothetical protein [Candidatus Omnitrophota bacterium]
MNRWNLRDWKPVRNFFGLGLLLFSGWAWAPACVRAEINLIENDRNQDGAADSWEYFNKGERVRWELDKNFDGGVDGVIHFERRFVTLSEVDSDFDGVLDDRFHFKDGMRAFNEYDVNHDGRMDKWEYFDARGRLSRTETDVDFDGKADSRTHREGAPHRDDLL